MDRNYYDIAIIGAGPAGCSAGIMLAKGGAKVLLLDKAEFPREKPCGGLLTEKAYKIITNTLGLKGLDGVILHKSDSFELYDGKQFLNRASTNRYTYYVSRRSFDNFLLASAEQAGCIVLTGTSISGIEPTALQSGKGRYEFQYLIGADGLNSVVRRHLQIPMPKNNLAAGLQVDIPLSRMRSHVNWDLPKIYFGYVKYGWAWAFPKGSYVSLGLAGLLPKEINIKDALGLFLADLSCQDAAKESPVRGAQIPYGSYVSSPARNNVLLIGDAAGFADPLTGEGIHNAVLSGVIAADILSGKAHTSKAEAYRNRCRTTIIASLRQSMVVRRFLFNEPFRFLAMKKFRGNARHLERFMRVLAGEADYIDYFCETVKRKFRAG